MYFLTLETQDITLITLVLQQPRITQRKKFVKMYTRYIFKSEKDVTKVVAKNALTLPAQANTI